MSKVNISVQRTDQGDQNNKVYTNRDKLYLQKAKDYRPSDLGARPIPVDGLAGRQTLIW